MRVAYAGFRPGRARSPRRHEASPRRVAFPHRLEDSLPKSPYLALTADQATQSQSTVSRPVSGGRPSGPFTISAPNLSFGSSCFGKPFVKGSPAQVGALSRPGTRPGIRPVLRNHHRRADRPRSLSRRLSAAGIGLLGILYPPGTWAFVTSGLPPPLTGVADPDGVSMFHTHETRLGLGALFTPGTMVSTRPRSILGRHLPPSNGPAPIIPALNPSRDVWLTRHQRGFTGIHPMPSLPLACGPRTERALLGFPVSFAPSRRWQRRSRTSRRGQVSDTDPGYVFSIG